MAYEDDKEHDGELRVAGQLEEEKNKTIEQVVSFCRKCDRAICDGLLDECSWNCPFYGIDSEKEWPRSEHVE